MNTTAKRDIGRNCRSFNECSMVVLSFSRGDAKIFSFLYARVRVRVGVRAKDPEIVLSTFG